MPRLPASATLHAAPPAAARQLRQPGPPQALRIQSQQAPGARHLRLHLQPGCSLFDALVLPLARLGVHHASVTLLGGWLDSTRYCVSVPDPAGQALLTHSAPIDGGRCCLVTANATLAEGADGQPLVHCHAALYSAPAEPQLGVAPQAATWPRASAEPQASSTPSAVRATAATGAPVASGRMRGGHLLAQHCRIGEDGIVAWVTGFHGFVLRATFDAETRLTLVQPHPAPPTAPGSRP